MQLPIKPDASQTLRLDVSIPITTGKNISQEFAEDEGKQVFSDVFDEITDEQTAEVIVRQPVLQDEPKDSESGTDQLAVADIEVAESDDRLILNYASNPHHQNLSDDVQDNSDYAWRIRPTPVPNRPEQGMLHAVRPSNEIAINDGHGALGAAISAQERRDAGVQVQQQGGGCQK